VAELDQIKDRLLAAARQGPIGRRLQLLDVERDIDDDEDEFLRVVITLTDGDPIPDADLERTLEELEDVAADIDPRYVSVRFLDAA